MMRKTTRLIVVLAMALALWAPGAMAQDDLLGAWTGANNLIGEGPDYDGNEDGISEPEFLACWQSALSAGLPADVSAAYEANAAQIASDMGAAAGALAPGFNYVLAIYATLAVTEGDGNDIIRDDWVSGIADALGGDGICGTGGGDIIDAPCYDWTASASAQAIIDACFGGPGDEGEPVVEPGTPAVSIAGADVVGVGRDRTYTATVTIPSGYDVLDTGVDGDYDVTVVFTSARVHASLGILDPETATDTQSVTVAFGEEGTATAEFVLTAVDGELVTNELDSISTTVSCVATFVATGTNADTEVATADLTDSVDVTVEYWTWDQGCEPKVMFDIQGPLMAGALGCSLSEGDLPSAGGMTDNELLFLIDENHADLANAGTGNPPITADERTALEDWKRAALNGLVTDWDTVNLDAAFGDVLIDSYMLNLLAYALCNEGAGDVIAKTAEEDTDAAAYAANIVLLDDWLDNVANIAAWLISAEVGVDVDPGSPLPSVPGRVIALTATSTAGDTEFTWASADAAQVLVVPDPFDTKSANATTLNLPIGVDSVKVSITATGQGTGCVGFDPTLAAPCTVAAVADDGDLDDDGIPDDASGLSDSSGVTVVRPVDPDEDILSLNLISACPDEEDDWLDDVIAEATDRALIKGAKKADTSAKASSRPSAGYIYDIQQVINLWNVADSVDDNESASDEAATLFGDAGALIDDLINTATGLTSNGLTLGVILTGLPSPPYPAAIVGPDDGNVIDYLKVYESLAAGQSDFGVISELIAARMGVGVASQYGLIDFLDNGLAIADFEGVSLTGADTPIQDLLIFANVTFGDLPTILTVAHGALTEIQAELFAQRSAELGGGTFVGNGHDDLAAFDAAVTTAVATAGLLGGLEDGDPQTPVPADLAYNVFIAHGIFGGLDTIYSGYGNYSGFDYTYDDGTKVSVPVTTHAELNNLIFAQVGGLTRSREDFVNAAVGSTPFFPGNPQVPVGGVVGLGLLAGACLTGGVALLRRKRS